MSAAEGYIPREACNALFVVFLKHSSFARLYWDTLERLMRLLTWKHVSRNIHASVGAFIAIR